MKEVGSPKMLAFPQENTVSPDHLGQPVLVPQPEVLENRTRRRFTVEYKLRILQDVDTLSESGQFGAPLRREGLYASHSTTWRRQRDNGTITALSRQKTTPRNLLQDHYVSLNFWRKLLPNLRSKRSCLCKTVTNTLFTKEQNAFCAHGLNGYRDFSYQGAIKKIFFPPQAWGEGNKD
jgi:hypothetical protein